MPALEKISLSNNKISELSPLMDSASIIYLNLTNNQITQDQIDNISHLPLKTLIVEKNPCDTEATKKMVI